jgi:hypothetical protein
VGLILFLAALGQPEKGQTLHSVFEAQDRVFPTLGPGVSVIKRSASGNYYILAKPADAVLIYSADGSLTGRIPNAGSPGAIRYAVDIDLSADGSLFVADRGANAVEIFNPDGSLAARVPVPAPTSVAALSGGQFAVTSLLSTRLVQILDEKGKLVRSFGDPSDLEDDVEKKTMANWGKIIGSPDGEIYFAFTALPDPMLRKYDRYGYVGYEASIPRTFFQKGSNAPNDRIEVRFNLAHISLADQTSGWVSFGSSGDTKFGGGLGTGFSRILGAGGGFGRAGMSSFGQAGIANGAAGAPGGSLGGNFAAQMTDEGTQFQFGAGNISSAGGGRRGRNAAVADNNFDQPAAQGPTLQFFGATNGDGDQYSSQGNSQVLAFNGSDSRSSDAFSGQTDAAADANQDLDLSAGTLFNSVSFQTLGPSAIVGGFPGGGLRFGHPNLGGPGGQGPSSFGSGAHMGAEHFGPHGRFGAGDSDFTATLRVNLGDLGGSFSEKPTITATAVDPATQELWAAIGDALVHFSKGGDPVEVYYLTLKGGTPVKPSAILVEPHRFLIAADPWGIFEYPRN